ncbi:hypothetical protein L1987_85962 [Smallanthus sonchifolius]|uniref:Uncharacterized protein n=1 Tax=Smallanthus sonchifolius TaxID=185202 RepID=A0ACB8XZ15_9ASTR|nr:hypothetical protein L1987_85962 [Smallanthus sonchifolius]
MPPFRPRSPRQKRMFHRRSILGGPIGPPRRHVPNPNPNSVGSYQSPHQLAALAPSSGKKSGRDKKSSRVDRESDNQQLLQLEEKDVMSSVATVISDLCGPGEWMPMEKLHTQLVEQYTSVWHHSRVRRYPTSDDNSGPEAQGKPWFGLLMLLRKYPEHFVINTRSRGRVTLEFVSLVSLIS